MKAPKGLDPEMRVVLEIMQHAGEIVSRLPLQILRRYLDAELLEHQDKWHAYATALTRAAEAFELANAELSAEEARTEGRAAPSALNPPPAYPDDALPSV